MKSSNFIIFLSLIFTSCSWINSKQDSQPQIRIVDLQGKTHPITTKVPELNAQALAAQGQTSSNKEMRPVQNGEVKYQNYQDQNLANAQATNSFPQSGQNFPKEDPLNIASKEPEQVVYDLAEVKEEKKSTKKSAKKEAITKTSGKKYYVQVGSFSNHMAADSLVKKMKKFHSGKVETIEGEKTIYRALLGPFTDKNKAKAVMGKITASGQDAIITKG